MLDRLAAAGVTTAVVNVHYFADRMEAHLAERTARGLTPRIIVSDERAQALETGGGVKQALPLLPDAPFWVAVWACFLVMWYAGFRKSDAVPCPNTPFGPGRLSRASVGYAPSARGTVTLITPPFGKSDQLGTVWAAHPTALPPRDPSDALDAATAVARLLALPAGDAPADRTPLFTFAPGKHLDSRAIEDALQDLLQAACPDIRAQDFSCHSFRIGAATTLNANGASLETIQHTLRWRSASSAMVYARPDPAAGSALAADMRASPAGRARGATRQG
jgi:hypothetical protein